MVVSIGLMGMARLMARTQMSEMESYQRVQALIIMSDITERLRVNREVASCFAFTTDLGAGAPFIGADGTGILGVPVCTAGIDAYNNQAIATITALDAMLKGAAEVNNDASRAGAMIGARSCISYDAASELLNGTGAPMPGTGLFTVSVAWQGLTRTFASPVNCANGLYGDERFRRVVSTTMRLAKLD